MPITILITQNANERRVACLKDGILFDIDREELVSTMPQLDQIYWGRVTGPVVGSSSPYVFVSLSDEHIGLLPVEPYFPKPVEGQLLLVQVRREAMPDKGTI